MKASLEFLRQRIKQHDGFVSGMIEVDHPGKTPEGITMKWMGVFIGIEVNYRTWLSDEPALGYSSILSFKLNFSIN